MSDSRFVLASRLARFLRKNGDKIINGSCKLSLTTSALCLLNSLFIDILQQDLYTNTDYGDSSIIGVQEDIKFLYDFMKKTTSLKLFHCMQTLRGGVDLSHFSNLIVLELRKIPAHLIIGLSCLSIQLKALICSRSIYLLKELFGSSVDEQNTSDVWTELKELNLSYNYLESLDNSIKCIPNVEILDLSHNSIKNTDEIQVLKRLNFVNLSYNQLEALPVFNSLSCRFMSKLYIRNNNLESLDGLECLFNLEEFDVGYNLLSEYSVLSPLDKLKSLKLLNLEGNPLFFHKHHFRLVCNFIHPFALNRGLHLNGKFIAIPQNMNLIYTDDDDYIIGHHQTSINTVVGDMKNVPPPSEIKPQMTKGVSSLISIAANTNSFDENSASSYTSQNSIEQAIATGTRPKKKKTKSKNKKGSVVIINEPKEDTGEIQVEEITKLVSTETQKHLLFKEMSEARREERGESWLIPDNPLKKLVNNLKVPANTPECKSETVPASNGGGHNILTAECFKEEMFNLAKKLECISSPPTDSEMQEVLEIQEPSSDTDSDRKRHISKESDDIEILASNLHGSPTTAEMKILNAEDLTDCDFYKNGTQNFTADTNDDDSLLESENESEDSIYFVERIENVKNMERKMISVKIGANYIKEKDVYTGKLLDNLDLSILSSVKQVPQLVVPEDDVKKFEIHLEFDTVKPSRQRRLYIFQDLASANAVCKILQPFADASTLKQATIGALECMNCKSIFSKQVAHRKVLETKILHSKDGMSSSYDSAKGDLFEVDACPNCKNHILVELESMPLPSVAAPPSQTGNTANATCSPGGSSGSSSSGFLFSNLLNSFKISPAPKRKSKNENTNENLGEAIIKTSEAIGIYQNEKDCQKRRESESQLSRNSSDVTIISNPSQSSIAVIPEPGVESILNTIVERESQSSLSPPISRSSTIHSNGKDCKHEDKPNGDSYLLSSKEEPDFYSITESFEGDKEKIFKSSDIASNDSDVYHSPYKSVGSSNLQTSEEFSDTEKLMLILGEKGSQMSDSFMHLDHRLKLHIEINVFSKDEYINCCLQTSIVPLSTGEEFEGVFLLSSKSIYVIKFLPQYCAALEQNESLAKHVRILYNGPLSQVKQIKVLLGNQGISIGCGSAVHVYTLVIRDVDTCNSFCNIVSEQILEKNPLFQCLTSTREMLQILYESVLNSESEEKPEILLHQFAFKKDKDVNVPICITLTKEDIFLSKVLYKKQQSCPDLVNMQPYFFTSSDCQKVSDVILLKLEEHFTVVEVCFLSESSDIASTVWSIEMPTKSSMFSFISALKTPWEEIFAVPLPLSRSESNS